MINMNHFVDLMELNKWPKKIKMKLIPQVGKIFYNNYCWKLVDRDVISHDISRKGDQSQFYILKNVASRYKDESLLVCYNPIFRAEKIKICAVELDACNILEELKAIKCKYTKTVHYTQICNSRKWICLGSEKEVDETKLEFREDKISVEWIGPLMSRREGVLLADYEPIDSLNGRIHFAPDLNTILGIKPRTKLDVGVQVYSLKQESVAQTDLCRVKELYENCCRTQESDREVMEVQGQYRFDDLMASSIPRQIDNPKEWIDEEHSFPVKSFVNIEYRHGLISSVDWHPCKTGYVAIAYYSLPNKNEELDYVTNNNQKLIHKKYSPMHEHDLRINERAFNASSRKNIRVKDSVESDDLIVGFADEEDELNGDDEFESLLSSRGTRPLCLYASQTLETKFFESSEKRSTYISDETPDESEELWSSRMHESCLQYPETCIEVLKNFRILSPENSCQETNVSGESSDSGKSSPTQPIHYINFPIHGDKLSDESENVEDDLQIVDADGSVLIWDCDDTLNPKMRLRSTHDINVVKFYPCNGYFIAGGDIGGQIVVWDLQTEWERSASSKQMKDKDWISKFMDSLPTWETIDRNFSTHHPAAVSDKKISHCAQITCVEWMHPSFNITSESKFIKVESGRERPKQILTSSVDGCIKIWTLKARPEGGQNAWIVELIYTIIALDTSLDKYWTPISAFHLFVSSLPYREIGDKFYECDVDGLQTTSTKMASKFHPVIVLLNNISQVGVVRWSGKDDDQVECFKHEWWSWCHDSKITSLSKNYYFPNIILATGGRIFSLWNIKYKGGPIWWRQYDKGTTLTQGCFTPFHPGVFYIGKASGKVDLWNVRKQIHEPVLEMTASGCSITCLSIVVPPCTGQQISVADSDGNFHTLDHPPNSPWNEKDLEKVAQFFKQSEESQKQHRYWNTFWQESHLRN